MCSSKLKSQLGSTNFISKIKGASVLEQTKAPLSPPVSPKLPSPRQAAIKRGKDPKPTSCVKKWKKCSYGDGVVVASSSEASLKYSSSSIVEAPGSIAAARREQVAIMQEQRKMRIAHYGRAKAAKYEGKEANVVVREQNRCSYITPNSDPIYVAYHDEEWGVPVHDDKLLFELLVLTGAQVGSDWTSILKKRQIFRDAFSGFDADAVAKYNAKKIISISTDYGIELSLIRGVVDNANRILQIERELGSFEKYLWGFVNKKPISTQYKACNKIPVKTSKSESISKDMVRKGFRFVGPTVIYSFMQAAGLTNDHLITCPRHLQCLALASQFATVAN
ncbi:hypothetical protein UlMin_020092 [Ulmus minor]